MINKQGKFILPALFVCIILPLLILACGGAEPQVNLILEPTTPPPSAAPTITTLPTYTPKPSATFMPTRTPEPTRTSLYHPTATATTVEFVANCVPSPDKGYSRCVDNTSNIQIDVPESWAEVNGGNWSYNGKDIGVALSAAPNLADFRDSLKASGLFFGASGTYAQYVGSTELLDIYTTAYRESCSLVGRYNYDDGVYIGRYDKYINCGGKGGSDAYILAAKDKVDPLSKLILIELQVPPGDTAIRDKIWGSFYVYF